MSATKTLERKNKTQAVSAIQNGTVIDHIPCGAGVKIVRLLGFYKHGKQMTIGLNLPSDRIGTKDLIKIEGWVPTHDLNPLSLLAPEATITTIKEYQVVSKFKPEIPHEIEASSVIKCQNPQCISLYEPVKPKFFIKKIQHKVSLQCNLCRKTFSLIS